MAVTPAPRIRPPQAPSERGPERPAARREGPERTLAGDPVARIRGAPQPEGGPRPPDATADPAAVPRYAVGPRSQARVADQARATADRSAAAARPLAARQGAGPIARSQTAAARAEDRAQPRPRPGRGREGRAPGAGGPAASDRGAPAPGQAPGPGRPGGGEGQPSTTGQGSGGAGGPGAAPGQAPGASRTGPGPDAQIAGPSPGLAAGPQSQSGRAESDKPLDLPPIPLPRLGIVAPQVPSPPRAALERGAQIRARTGSPPEVHHARVSQALLGVVEAARAAQRQAVWRIERLAGDTWASIDRLADELEGVMADAIGQVDVAIGQAHTEIDGLVGEILKYLKDSTVIDGERLQSAQIDLTQQVQARLVNGSVELQGLHAQLVGAFDPLLNQAKSNVKRIPLSGVASPIELPPQAPAPPAGPAAGGGPGGADPGTGAGGGAPKARCTAGGPGEGGATGPTAGSGASAAPTAAPSETLPAATLRLSQGLGVQAAATRIGAYQSARITPVLFLEQAAEQQARVTAANRQAELLTAVRGQFISSALGLVAPVKAMETGDCPDNKGQVQQEFQNEQARLDAARVSYEATIKEKHQGVLRHLDQVLRPSLTEGLRKAGGKAVKALRDQARVAEHAALAQSPGAAAAYPGLVERVAALVSPGRFLDSRDLGPKLQAALLSAQRLPDQQLGPILEQAEAAVAAARESRTEQSRSLLETAAKSIQGVGDVVTGLRFELDLYVGTVTGHMRQGSAASIRGAVDYAARVAGDLLETKGKVGGRLNELLRQTGGELNRQIAAAGQSYFLAVKGFDERLTGQGGTFEAIRKEVLDDLNKRATKLDDALPHRDLAAAGGMALVPGLGVLAAGYYVYQTDADEDVVFKVLGDLPWPGPPALEQYFAAPGGYGVLQDRIKDSMDASDANHALMLFSSSAQVRGEGRLAAAESSLSVGGPDRGAREALLRGLGEAEREAVGGARVEQAVRTLGTDLSGTELSISASYARGNPQAALAARMDEAVARARRQGDDAIKQAMAQIEQMAQEELSVHEARSHFTEKRVQAFTDRAYIEFAAQRRGETRAASEIGLAEARQTFITTVTADRLIPGGPRGGPGRDRMDAGLPDRRVAVNQQVKDYVTAAVTRGHQSAEARAASAIYEFRRAGASGRPSETGEVRVTQAFENPQLHRLERELAERGPSMGVEQRNALRARIAEERTKHEAQMRLVAEGLLIAENPWMTPELARAQIAQAGSATEYMARRAETLFSGESRAGRRDADERMRARYGRELITGGRASLEAGIYLATKGWGTNEDLLRQTFTGRSKREVAATRVAWREHQGEDLDAMLGLGERNQGWFTETSGDLALELEILAKGEPETDQDHAEIAALRYRQERVRGTGFIARHTMQGTPEQQRLDAQQLALGQQLLDAARRRDPTNRDLPTDPRAIFAADGTLDPRVARLAFAPRAGADGQVTNQAEFQGDRVAFFNNVEEVRRAGESYRAEIDRQESLITGFLSALAMVVSIALLFIPGVNIIAAGILTALIVGTATMVAKAGMRGGRYGWEEAATDAGMMAIEAATAAAGGALAGGMGGRVGALGKAVGARLTARLGKVGAAVAREAITNAVSSAAQVAIQDETWRDGFGAGFGKVLGGGAKGAAVGALSAGVSEGLEGKLNRALSRGAESAEGLSRAQRLGAALGPKGRAMVTGAISEGLGSVAGEAGAIGAELIGGDYRGGLKEALARMGRAGARDLLTGGARAGVLAHNKARYGELLAAARRGGELSDRDLRILHLAAISAGEVQLGEGLGGLIRVRAEVEAGRERLAILPPALRAQAAGLGEAELARITQAVQSGSLGDARQRAELVRDLAEKAPGLAIERLMGDLDAAVAARARPSAEGEPQPGARPALEPERRARVQEDLTAGLDPEVRRTLGAVEVEGLDRLPPAGLKRAADLVAQGRFDQETADALLRAAQAEDPKLDAFGFLKNLKQAVEAAGAVQENARLIRAKARASVLADLPEAGRAVLADLSDAQVARIKAALDAGEPLHPEAREALVAELQRHQPDLDRATLDGLLEAAGERAAARRAETAQARAEDRLGRMSNVPEDLRGTLSALPDHALIELRVVQSQGGALDAPRRARLIEAARRETPGADPERIGAALDALMGRAASAQPWAAEGAGLRERLAEAVPADRRGALDGVPILVMPDAEFRSFTRSALGQAVTLIIEGRPVVVLREGADPGVLREEGLHVLQARDPDWARRVGALDERRLSQWDRLPLAEQLALYRNKVAIEIDAQRRLIADLESRPPADASFEGRARQAAELERVRSALDNLARRMTEVGTLSPARLQAMEAGVLPRPQWLDQPARLFHKDKGAEVKPPAPKKGPKAEDPLGRLLADLAPEHQAAVREAAGRLPPEVLDLVLGARLGPAETATLITRALGALEMGHLRTLGADLAALGQAQRADLLAGLAAHPSLGGLVATGLGTDRLLALARQAVDIEDPGAARAFVDDLARITASAHPDNAQFILDEVSRMRGAEARSQVASALARVLELVPGTTRAAQEVQTALLATVLFAEGKERVGRARLLDQALRTLPPEALRALGERLAPLRHDELTGTEPSHLLQAALDHPAIRGLMVSDLAQGTVLSLARLALNTPPKVRGAALAALDQIRTGTLEPELARRVLDRAASLQSDDQAIGLLTGLARVIASLPGEVETQRRLVESLVEAPRAGQAATRLAELVPHLDGPGRRALAEFLEGVAPEKRLGLIGAIQHQQRQIADLGLPVEQQGQLLNALVEGGAGRTHWDAHLQGVDAILKSASGLGAEDRKTLVDYVVKGRTDTGESAMVAADLAAAARALASAAQAAGAEGAAAAREAKLRSLIGELRKSSPPRLTGGDAWLQRLADAEVRWSRPPEGEAERVFADLIREATKDPRWTDGQRGILLEQRAWFDKMVALRVAAGETPDRLALLKDLLAATEPPASADKHNRLARELRERTVKADPLFTGPDSKTRALERVGLTEADLAKRPDGAALLDHLLAMERQLRLYDRMVGIAEEIGASTAGLTQQRTEMLGELALTRAMLERGPELQLQSGFAKGTGFDQVWARFEGGVVKELIIGEAKGFGATLGTPDKGPQMGSRWVLATILELVKSGDPLGRQLLDAVLKGTPPIRGLIVEAPDPKTAGAKPPAPPPVPDGGGGPAGWRLLDPALLNHPKILAQIESLAAAGDPQAKALLALAKAPGGIP